MLSRVPFYHSTTKKMVISFGNLFSNIYCVTKDSTGNTKKIVNVPLAYANKEKFIIRLQQDAKLSEDVQIVLPRMSYEIVGTDYDSSRQLNKLNKIISVKNERNVYMYSPVPYILSFRLYSFTRTNEDNLQILEQIVPYFTPDMNLSIKVLQNPDVVQDCALTLTSVNTDDQYDGGFEDRRYIITTYDFSLKMNYFSPYTGINDPENHFENGKEAKVIKSVKVNVNTNKYHAIIDPFEANENDPYVIKEGWDL